MALAAGLYLFDSALLLYANEGLLTPTGRRDWRVSFGSEQIRVLGKEVFVPHPLLPHRPQFRLRWHVQFDDGAIDGGWEARRALFRPLMPTVWGMAFALFVLLPIGLFSRLGEPMLIAAIVLLYLNIVAALLWLGIKRSEFGLSGKRFVLLAFESLVCSPLAINLIRKISAGMPIDEDLAHVARRLQTPDAWDLTRMAIVARLDEELALEDEGTEHAATLRRYREGLVTSDPPCQE